MSKIELGNEVESVVDGIKGITVCQVIWSDGSIQFGIRIPNDKTQAVRANVIYVDSTELTLVSEGINTPKGKFNQIGYRHVNSIL